MNRRIIILDNNYIRVFGVHGPITTPTYYDDSVVRKILADGHRVYERLADGTTKRLTLADLDKAEASAPAPVAAKPAPKKAAEKPVTKKETVVEEPAPIETTEKVFDGMTEKSAPVLPEKTDIEPTAATTSKSQRKAQKKARYEAQKAAEAEAAATEEATDK